MREKERTGVIRGMILPEIVPEMMFLEDCPAMRGNRQYSPVPSPSPPCPPLRVPAFYALAAPRQYGDAGVPRPAFRSGEPRPRNQKESP